MSTRRCCRVILGCVLGIVGVFPVSGTAQAAGMLLGTNLGFGYYSPDQGDGLTLVTIPDQGSFFGTFRPGLRIGGFADEAGRHEVYVDTGMSLLSTGGSSLTSIQLRGGYDYFINADATSPFVGLSLGVMHLGYDQDSASAPVIGGEFGVRHTLAHGHGAVRGAFRVEHQFESGGGRNAFLPALNVFGLEVGLDLYLK